jgi:NAD(P)-dependent dehydrogenase (short-subunit alcohol dehydrogenase family)
MLVMFIVFQELSKSLLSEKGKMYAIKCDVTKEYDIETAFKWVKDNLGGVDILVNNAGVALPTAIIGKTPRQLLVVLMIWFFRQSRQSEKRPLVSLCASVRPHDTTQLPLEGFIEN